MLSFFPRDVLDEILDLIESVSEGLPTYRVCYFHVFGETLLSSDQRRTYLSSLQLVLLCRFAALKRLPVHHDSADYIFGSLGTLGSF